MLDVWGIFQGNLNQGGLKMPNGVLSADCGQYDPNRDDHWPDRMRAAALALKGASDWTIIGKDTRQVRGHEQRHALATRPY